MKVDISIPSDLSEIKLSQHQEFVYKVKDSEDEDFINDNMVSIFCNIDIDNIRYIKRKDYDDIVSGLTMLLNEEPKLKPIIHNNGVKYGLIPDMSEMTVGEQADLDSLYSDYSKRQKVLSILYRPITVISRGKYLIEDYTNKEEPLDLTLDIVKGVDVFFLSILNDCMNIIQSYIKEGEVQKNLSKTSLQNGVGIKTSMRLLEEMFLNLRKQLKLN